VEAMGNQLGCTTSDRDKNTDETPIYERREINGNLSHKAELLMEQLTPDGDAPTPAPPKVPKEGASVTRFKGQFWLAFRTASMMLLLSFPMIVPPLYNHLCEPVKGSDGTYSCTKTFVIAGNVVKSGPWLALIPGGVMLMCVFTVYQNLGNTVQLAWQGAIGTLWACIFAHVVSARMPNGAYCGNGVAFNCTSKVFNATTFEPSLMPSKCTYDATTVNIVNCLFMFCTVWFNISANVRMFILSYHVYFVMAIQDPCNDPLMNESWSLDWQSQTTQTMGTALIGLLAAVLVTVFPVPKTATSAARQAAFSATNELNNVLDEIYAYYTRDSPSVSITALETQCRQLRESIQTMQTDIESAWWEKFDIGSAGRVRRYLTGHVSMLKTVVDNIFAVQISVAKEDFGKTHKACMKAMSHDCKDLLDDCKKLQEMNVAAAADGSISEEEKTDLLLQKEKVTDNIKALAKKFNEVRQNENLFKQVGAPHVAKSVVNSDLQGESFFFYCLSIHARLTADYTDDMLSKSNTGQGAIKELIVSLCSMFSPGVLKSRLKWNSFTVRSTAQLLGSYFFGMYVSNYNAAASCTISLLLNEFMGSAMLKNLNRLQAVVLSAVIPFLIKKFVKESCDPFMVCIKGFAIFAWELLTCYIYYSSASLGYIGCLLAAFASATLVYPCVNRESAALADAATEAFETAQYQKIWQTTVAVLIMLLVDRILFTGEASTMATEKILKGYVSLDAWFQSAFLQRETGTGKVHPVEPQMLMDIAMDKEFEKQLQKHVATSGKLFTDTVVGLLADAERLGNEADKEPRYDKMLWPMGFYDQLVRTGHLVRANIGMMEQVLEGDAKSTAPLPYEDIFESVREMPEFMDMAEKVRVRMNDTIAMIKDILDRSKGLDRMQKQALMDQAMKVEGAGSRETAKEKLFYAINNKSRLRFPPVRSSIETLEKDQICRVNVVLMLMEAAMDDVHIMREACMKMAA
jgi:hypothetical protein